MREKEEAEEDSGGNGWSHSGATCNERGHSSKGTCWYIYANAIGINVEYSRMDNDFLVVLSRLASTEGVGPKESIRN